MIPPRADSQRTTAILLTAADARRLQAEQPEAGAILALTPPARAALDRSVRSLIVANPITHRAHARIAARTERAARQFMAALRRESDFRRSTRRALEYQIRVDGYLAAMAWESLRDGGPWLLPENGGWALLEDRAQVQIRLLEQTSAPPNLRRPPPIFKLYRLLRRLVIFLLRGRGPWILTRKPELMYGLENRLKAERPPFRRLIVRTVTYGGREYQRLLQSLLEGFSKNPVVALSVTANHDESARAAVERALAAISDPVVRGGITGSRRHHLFDQAAHCEGLFADAVEVFRGLAPRCYVSRQDSGTYAAVSEAAGAAGVPRYLVNYNCFPASDSAIADSVLRFHFNHRMPQGLSDNILLWSPHLATLGRRVFDEATAKTARPLKVGPPDLDAITRRPGNPRVLHASNFTEWGFFFPWIMETSNEFVDDILALVDEMAKLDEVELTVRTKVKGECSPEVLQKLLPEKATCRVTGVEQPFAEALRDADLVVGFMSTTLAEAVVNRVPVLLFGPTRRYLHFPARATAPTPEDRAAVYVANEKQDLVPMISAILAAHVGRPLTDAEISGHIWPEGTPTIEDLAREIAALG